jgi:hypothetical protein
MLIQVIRSLRGLRISLPETAFDVARKGETNGVRSASDARFTAGLRATAILVAN